MNTRLAFTYVYLDRDGKVKIDADDGFVHPTSRAGQFILSDKQDELISPRRYDVASIVTYL